MTVILQRRDGRVLIALWRANKKTGLTTHALMLTAKLYGGWFQASIDRLVQAGLIESRWYGEPWPGSRAKINELAAAPGKVRPRYYRLTETGRVLCDTARHQT